MASNTSEAESIKGATIRVMVHEFFPYVTYNATYGSLDGFIGDFWHNLEDLLGFRSEIIVENKLKACVDRMSKGEADVLLGAFVTNGNFRNVRFSQPYMMNWFVVGHRKLDTKVSSDFLMHIYDGKVMLAALVFYVVSTILLWLGLQIMSKYRRQPTESFTNCFVHIIGGFLTQVTEIDIVCYSLRILTLFLMVFGYMLITGFNAVLISKLADARQDEPLVSIDDGYVRPSYNLCVRNYSFAYRFFLKENEIDPKWRGVFNEDDCLGVNSLETLPTVICRPNTVIMDNRVVVGAMLRFMPIDCDVDILSQRHFPSTTFFIYHNAFRFQRDTEQAMQLMKSAGILQYLEMKWFSLRNPASSSDVPFTPIELNHVSVMFLVYAAAVMFSLAILVGEIIHCRMRQPRRLANFYYWLYRA